MIANPARAVGLFLAASLVVPLLVLVLAAWHDWRHLSSHASEGADHTVIALAEHAQRVLGAQDSALRLAAEKIEGRPLASVKDDRELHWWFRRLAADIEYLSGISIIGADGKAVTVSRHFPAPAIDASDRAYFAAFVRDPDLELFVSEPIVARPSGERIFQLARRLSHPDGSFKGVVIASARPQELAKFYARVAADGDVVTMARSDGSVLARYPATSAEEPAATYVTSSEAVTPWPVTVSYSANLSKLRAHWLRRVAAMATVALVAALTLLAMAAFALRRAKSEQTAIKRLEEEAAARGRAEAEAQLGKQMKTLQAELAQVSRVSSMGAVAASIAHELNQPLGAVAAYSQAARRLIESGQTDSPLLARAVEAAGDQALRAGEIVHRLRRFISKGELALERVDLSAVVHDATTLMSSTGDLARARIRLNLDRTADAVVADRVQLQQVIVNLLKNAVEAGGTETEIAIASSPVASRSVEVSISDRGSGIPDHVMSRLFEPFHSTKREGMGIGLSICQSIIRAHGSELVARNSPAGGAIFSFTLPLFETAGSDAAKATA
jgi:signal transduction histidine kinase